MPTEKLISNLINRAQDLYLSPKLETSNDDLPDTELYKLYDILADQKMKLRFEESYNRISDKMVELPEYRQKYGETSKETQHFESYIEISIKKLIHSVREFVKEASSGKLTKIQPDWVMPMQFAGASSIIGNSNYEFVRPGKTTGAVIIKQKTWQERPLKTDAGFIIAVVNCPVRDIDDRNVSGETLRSASSGDRETFDSVHELERIYAKHPLGLGVVQIDQNNLQIQSNYHLQELFLKHIAKSDNPSSLLVYIISESYSLLKNGKSSVSAILNCIPFPELKEKGITEIAIDFISCNTAEIAEELVKNAEKIANKDDLTVKISFHNGYIFNNITYCYVDTNDYKKLEQNLTIPEKLYSSPDLKKSTLLQIMHPGFSSVFAHDLSHLGKYVSGKKVTTKTDGTVEKKLLIPDAIPEIQSGTSWQYTAPAKSRATDASHPSSTLKTQGSNFAKSLETLSTPHQSK